MSEIKTQEEFDLQSITPSDVRSVYSGKQGCQCGCRGNYRYHPDHLVEASHDRGYPISKDEVNLRQVKRILDILKRDKRTHLQAGSILYIEKIQPDERAYVAYLTKAGVKKLKERGKTGS